MSELIGVPINFLYLCKMIQIYALIDPITNEIRYVGKAKDSHKRFIRHIWEAKKSGNKIYSHCWINSLLAKNLEPIQEILDEVDDDCWQFWERFYIQKYKKEGCSLTNLCEGGIGNTGYKHTEEWKREASKRNKGKLPWNTGKKLSEEHKLAKSIAQMGRKFSEETKKKIGKANEAASQKKSKLTKEDILYIRTKPMTQRKLAEKYGVLQSHISNIQRRKVWKNV